MSASASTDFQSNVRATNELCLHLCKTFYAIATKMTVRTSLRTDVETLGLRLNVCRDPEVKRIWDSLCEMTCSWQTIPLSASEMCVALKQLFEALEQEIGVVIGADCAAIWRYQFKMWVSKSVFRTSCFYGDFAAISEFGVCPADISLDVLPRHLLSDTLTKNVQMAFRLSTGLDDPAAMKEFEETISWICINFGSHLNFSEDLGDITVSKPDGMTSMAEGGSLPLCSSSASSSSTMLSQVKYRIEKSLDSEYVKRLFSPSNSLGSSTVMDRSSTDDMKQHIERLRSIMSAEAFGDFSSMCLKCLSAIIDTPKEAKYRRIRIDHPRFYERIWQHEQCRNLLFLANFSEHDGLLVLPMEMSLGQVYRLWELLSECRDVLSGDRYTGTRVEVPFDRLGTAVVLASSIGVAFIDLDRNHVASNVAIVQLETALTKQSLTGRIVQLSSTWTDIKAAIRGRLRVEMTQSEYVSIRSQILSLIDKVQQAMSETLGSDSVELTCFTYLTRLLTYVPEINADLTVHATTQYATSTLPSLNYFTPQHLPVDRLSSQFMARAEVIHELSNGLAANGPDHDMASIMLKEMLWMYVTSHNGVISPLNSALRDSDTIANAGVAKAVWLAVRLAGLVVDAFVAIRYSSALPADFTTKIMYHFRQLRVCQHQLVKDQWLQLCQQTADWSQITRSAKLSQDLWSFTDVLRGEMLASSGDIARLFAVTRSIVLMWKATSFGHRDTEWLNEVGNVLTRDQFTPHLIGPFFMEPFRNRLESLFYAFESTEFSLGVAAMQVDQTILWIGDKFEQYLKHASHLPDQAAAYCSEEHETCEFKRSCLIDNDIKGTIDERESLTGCQTSLEESLLKQLTLLKSVIEPDVNLAFRMIRRSISNIIQNPNNSKYRRIKTASGSFQRVVWHYVEAQRLYTSLGFCEEFENARQSATIFLPDDASLDKLICLEHLLQRELDSDSSERL